MFVRQVSNRRNPPAHFMEAPEIAHARIRGDEARPLAARLRGAWFYAKQEGDVHASSHGGHGGHGGRGRHSTSAAARTCHATGTRSTRPLPRVPTLPRAHDDTQGTVADGAQSICRCAVLEHLDAVLGTRGSQGRILLDER